MPGSATVADQFEGSPWGGLSGALVFCENIALGVVIQHRPRQSRSPITITPVERFAAVPVSGDPDSLTVAAALGLPAAHTLPLAGSVPLARLVDVTVEGRLPRVADLDPYTLGATPSAYGNASTYGQRDEYVLRATEEPLAAALRPGRLVVLAGPAKAGKTRTAFQVLRGPDWGSALLAAPRPRSLEQLAGHPALSGSDPLVIWLDDLPRFLPPAGVLSEATISRLADRPGPTVLLATLRDGPRQLFRGHRGELTREARMVLNNATTIELGSIREFPAEQARATAAYPQEGSRPDGLAEMLAGAPELLRRYRAAANANPLLHTLVQTCIDWARCGLTRPINKPDLITLVRDTLKENRPALTARDDEIGEALLEAVESAAGEGQAALLRTHLLTGQARGYEAFGTS